MNFVYGIISLSAPLLLASMGALISERSGGMALFLDGTINLAAFLCLAGTALSKNFIGGIALSLTFCTAFILLFALAAEKFRANRFLAALALNLICSALTSILSSVFFKTRGIITHPDFYFSAVKTRLVTTASAYLMFLLGWAAMKFTRQGLYIRISGSDAPVLRARGINVSHVRLWAWAAAAVFGSAAGCILSMRLSSFVPNISSGTGWTALAAVFLGKKNTYAILAAVLIFAAAQYVANNLQNFSVFGSVPAAFLLALPYISALVMIVLAPKKP
ncbi:ABC transporter permease [Treponema parvum]|uniref:ABC transporter permease n=1 Tax=Treponema parvum TaxID=138851 RepID=A0A975F2Y2_9SPIR|nr:ABC transporter permease [Treponema parvum]QTQ13571.1 ABC transporter permease [Treponema parvum]